MPLSASDRPFGFAADRWDAARRRVVARAFRTVPFYREQWAAAGRVLTEPEPVPARDLTEQLFRLCPLGRPFDPAREPSLWTDDAGTLRAALRALCGPPARRPTAVVEVRPAMIDRSRLGRNGPRYAAYLPPGADVVDERRRHALNRRAVAVARSGDVIVVGTGGELAEVLPELTAVAPGSSQRLRPVPRAALADALDESGPVMAHDPVLGYYAVRRPSCGRLHVLWRHFHARVADGYAVRLTALRRRRPTLCDVIPTGAERGALAMCPDHATPTLRTR
jgi:hypothetical protein